MAVQRDKAEWNRMKSVVCTLINQNLAEGDPPVQPNQIEPYATDTPSTRGTRVPLRAANIDILRTLIK